MTDPKAKRVCAVGHRLAHLLEDVPKDPMPLHFETREEYHKRCQFNGITPLTDDELRGPR